MKPGSVPRSTIAATLTIFQAQDETCFSYPWSLLASKHAAHLLQTFPSWRRLCRFPRNEAQDLNHLRNAEQNVVCLQPGLHESKRTACWRRRAKPTAEPSAVCQKNCWHSLCIANNLGPGPEKARNTTAWNCTQKEHEALQSKPRHGTFLRMTQ